MVYEDRDEMELAEEDRLYERDPYEESDFSDTFREQLNDPADDESMSEDEATAPTPESDTTVTEVDEFGETILPADSEDEMDKAPKYSSGHDPLDEE